MSAQEGQSYVRVCSLRNGVLALVNVPEIAPGLISCQWIHRCLQQKSVSLLRFHGPDCSPSQQYIRLS